MHIAEKILRELFVSPAVQVNRRLMSRAMDRYHNGTVAHGPFKGLILPRQSWWGEKDRAAMLLGLYEKEVLDLIADLAPSYTSFVNIGAADGYYAVGAVKAGLFPEAIAYELSAHGQQVIAANATNNGVRDKIHIRGAAADGFWKASGAPVSGESLVLMDVEGAEFDILTPDFFAHFNRSTIIVELHPFLVSNGPRRLEQIIADAQAHFTTEVIATGARDLSPFAELRHYEDNDRWIVASEGRLEIGEWLVLRPRADN